MYISVFHFVCFPRRWKWLCLFVAEETMALFGRHFLCALELEAPLWRHIMQPVVSMTQAWNHNTLWRDDREHKIRSFFLKVSGAQVQRQVATESHSWWPLRVSGSWKALIWYLYQPKGTSWYLEQRPGLHTRLCSPTQPFCFKMKMNCSLVVLCTTKINKWILIS